MSLTPGARLGPYEVIERLGVGGMGEVFRARDTRLERSVALKVLAPHISTRADAIQRFEREARTVAALNHPNICALYDIGETDGARYLVMEYLEGETLAKRLEKGPLALDAALTLAMQIADALDKAHRSGVTHRDLKPGNIMITRQGAKLLDFGLAKAMTAPSPIRHESHLPTVAATPITAEGTIVGTLQYMAPEQLEGRDAGARTDIFALGTVIYESVTGRRAFEATSQASLISAIMSGDPPSMTSLQAMTPKTLDRLVRSCLAKDPDDRWQTAHDVVLQLRAMREANGEVESAVAPVVSRRRSGRLNAANMILGALLLAIAAAALWMAARPAPVADELPMRFAVLPPQGTAFAGGEVPQVPVISPDGTRLALVAVGADGQKALWIQRIDSSAATRLAGTEDASFPFWSPDSRSIAFDAFGKLRRIDAAGGSVQTLCDANWGGGAWSPRGTIVFAVDNTTGLRRVSQNGGDCTVLTTPDPARAEFAHTGPAFLPDGVHYLFTKASTKPEQSGFYVGSIDSPATTLLLPGIVSGTFVPPDTVILADWQSRSVTVRTFDVGRAALRSDSKPLGFDMSGISVSSTGVMALRDSSGDVKRHLVWYDRHGAVLGTLGEAGEYANPRLSPDGEHVIVARADGPNVDLWWLDSAGGGAQRWTSDPANDNGPVWSPDGKRVAFSSNRAAFTSVYVKEIGAAMGSEKLAFSGDGGFGPNAWSAQHGVVMFRQGGSARGLDIWRLPPGTSKAVPVLESSFNEVGGVPSPDGRWLAFVSDESGRYELYIQPFDGTDKVKVSNGGGFPVWRGDGRELFYLAGGNQLMAVDITPGTDRVTAGTPHRLFSVNAVGWPTGVLVNFFDVTRDGQRFLFNVPVEESPSSGSTVIVNWSGLLKK